MVLVALGMGILRLIKEKKNDEKHIHGMEWNIII